MGVQTSRLARALWIEIWGRLSPLEALKSRLARALWIEIKSHLPNNFESTVEARESLVD